MPLTLPNALSTIELALQYHLLTNLGKCVTVASNAALTALSSAALADGAQAFVNTTPTGRRWIFARYSTATASSAVLVPDDTPTAGRWIATSSTSGSGYLKAVELFEGNVAVNDLMVRLKGRRPGVVITYDGDEWTNPSVIAGALYRNDYTFTLHCISSNLRAEKQASTGSGVLGNAVAAEVADDPGVNFITGDVARVLAGSTLDGTEGIRHVEIAGRAREMAQLADRVMVYALRIKVFASVHNIETDGATLDLSSFAVTRALANVDGTTDTLEPTDIVTLP